MGARSTRRDVISATAAGVVAAAWPRLGAAQHAALKVTDLGSELALIEGGGANVVALGTADGFGGDAFAVCHPDSKYRRRRPEGDEKVDQEYEAGQHVCARDGGTGSK